VADGNDLEDDLASLRIDQGARREGRWASTTSRSLPSVGGRSPRAPEGSRRLLGWLAGVVVLLALLGGGWVLVQRGQAKLFPEEVELGAVSLMSPSTADVMLVATGYVIPRKKATIAPKVNGRVSRVLVEEGDLVKEGQLLAELEAVDAQAQMAQVRADAAAARARVERARADVNDAQTRFQREDDLLKRGAGTQSAHDDAKARLTAAKAQLTAAEAEVRAVEARAGAVNVLLDATKVRAPFTGTIVRKIAEVGEVLPAGVVGVSGYAAGLFTLIDLTDLEVQADVAEVQLQKVKVGSPAEILLDAFPDRRFRGTVADVRRTIDRAKAAVLVKVRFVGDVTGVLPDMAAKVSFLAKPLEDKDLKASPKLVVPADAVAQRNGRSVVFTIDEGHARETPVTLGPPLPGNSSVVELASGPPASTKVVRRPSAQLSDGASILSVL
jgi:RND family efflux transporter MFP subunit